MGAQHSRWDLRRSGLWRCERESRLGFARRLSPLPPVRTVDGATSIFYALRITHRSRLA